MLDSEFREDREGEVQLLERVCEDEFPNEVLNVAISKDLRFDSLKVDRIMKDGTWVSTTESTFSTPILYFVDSKGNHNHLITKIQGSKNYALFKYRWIS